MGMFASLYERVLRWSAHPHAERYLAGVSFAESSFFPVPPDVLLAPMTLAQPARWWRFALVTTLASVLGGLAGYLIGRLALDAVTPLLQSAGYWDEFLTAKSWFDRYGFWAVFIAGFTPIPYKVFTIAAGAVHMALLPFVLGSAVGRAGRFFLVAGLVRWGGPRVEQHLRRWVDGIGWATLILLVGGYVLWRMLH